MSRWDVIIIGSGISSLTCAALLSKKGKSVCVLERHSKPGGYMHCFSRNGVRFDTGAHYVGAMGEGQPFRTLLKYLGVYDPELFVPLDSEGFDVFRFPGFSIELPKGYEAVIRRLSDRFPGEAPAIRKYFELVQKTAHSFPTYEFEENTDISFMLCMLETSLAKVVDELTQVRELQAILYSYCALHGVVPQDVSFGLHAVVTDSLIRGPYGLASGGDSLADRFVKRIEENGGSVQLGKEVVSIENTGRMANAVITADGERFEANWIISGVHPQRTVQLVSAPEAFSPAFRDRIAKLKESVGIFGIYARCCSQGTLNPLKNYYYFGSTDPAAMFTQSSPDQVPSAAFVCPSSRIPSDAMALSIHAASPLEWFEPWREFPFGKRPSAYHERKAAFADNIFRLIDRFEPGFSQNIESFTTSSPLTNIHFNGSPWGSAYGLYHSIDNTGARAIGPRSHIANLLLTGQSCLFPGLLGGAIAGLRTSGHILEMRTLLKELQDTRGMV